MRQELYLMNQLADLPINGIGIPILKAALDYSQGVSARKGDQSFTVSLDATGRNTRIMNQRFDPQRVKKWQDVRQMSARYYVEGTLILSGLFKVKQAKRGSIDIEIIADNIAWAQLFGQRKITDLETLESIAFIGSKSQYPAIEPADAVTQPDVWSLGKNTQIQFPMVAMGNYFQSGGLSSGESAYRLKETDWEVFPPEVFIAPVIRAMFTEAGLTVIGNWINNDFFTDLHLPYVGDMAVPWNWGFLARAKAEKTTADLYEVGIGFPLDTNFQYNTGMIDSVTGWYLRADTETYDYSRSNFLTPQHYYVCPTAGVFEVSVELDISAMFKNLGFPFVLYNSDHDRIAIAVVRVPDDADELNALKADIGLYLTDPGTVGVFNTNIIGFFDFGTGYADGPMNSNTPDTTGTTYSQTFNGIPKGTPGSAINGSGIVSMISTGILAQADVVQVWMVNTTPGNYLNAMQVFTDSYTLTIRETSLPERLAAETILPSVSQLELFETMIRMFNLHWQVEGSLIRIESHDDFYKPVQVAKAFDSSLRPSTNKPVPYAKSTQFEWVIDSNDVLLQRHGQGRYGYVSKSQSVHFDRDSETVSLSPFSATIDRKFIARNNATLSNDTLIIPCMATEATLGIQQDIEWEYGFAPRILRWIGMQPGRFEYAGMSMTEYPAARFAFSEIDGLGLLWGTSNGDGLLHDRGSMIDYVPSLGLFRYWTKLFVHRQQSELVTVLVKITTVEFAQLDVSRPVMLEGIAYVIYSLGNGFDPVKDSSIEMGLMRI